MRTVTRRIQPKRHQPIFCVRCGGVITPRREADRPVNAPDGRYHAACYVVPLLASGGRSRASDLYPEDH